MTHARSDSSENAASKSSLNVASHSLFALSGSRSSSRWISSASMSGFMTRVSDCQTKTLLALLPKKSRCASYRTPLIAYGLDMAISLESGIVAMPGFNARKISVSGLTPCESQNATSSQITAAMVKPLTLLKSLVLTMITVPLSNSSSSALSLTTMAANAAICRMIPPM